MDLMPFQKAGVSFAMSRPNSLIADEMGLGKTIQAIETINQCKAKFVLIVCPNSLKLNWKAELERWLRIPIQVFVIGSNTKSWPLAVINGCIYIINYDILTKFRKELRICEYDVLVCDESHYLKNDKANRTKEICGSKDIEPIRAKKKIFLTGTPVLNRPSELWPTVKALCPPNLFGKSFFQFGMRYCDGHKVKVGRDKEIWDFKGASNLEELSRKLSGSIMIRRFKKDVLKELPDQVYQTIEIDLEDDKSKIEIIEEEKILYDIHENLKRQIAGTSDTEALEKLRETRRAKFGELAEARKNIGVLKIPYTEEIINSVDHKIVIFAHHRQVIELLHVALENSVILHGGMKDTDRNESVRAFQEDPDIQFFIGSLYASGVGLTLTAASHVVFHELDWVPGVMEQAIARCHRIGQKNAVLVQSIVFKDSLDARMIKTLNKKQAILDQV